MPEPEGNLVVPVGFNAEGYPRAGNLPFTYYAYWYEKIEDTSIPTGLSIHSFTTVPSNELWITKTLCGYWNKSTIAKYWWEVLDGSIVIRAVIWEPSADWQAKFVVADTVIPPGGKLQILIEGASGGEHIWGWVSGYKMQL